MAALHALGLDDGLVTAEPEDHPGVGTSDELEFTRREERREPAVTGLHADRSSHDEVLHDRGTPPRSRVDDGSIQVVIPYQPSVNSSRLWTPGPRPTAATSPRRR